jgi:hypothetical protein
VLAQLLQLRAQDRQFALNHIPDESEIYAEVFVDELVAHAGDLPPGHRRLQSACAVRDALDCLADDLDVADDGILGLAIRENASRPSTV